MSTPTNAQSIVIAAFVALCALAACGASSPEAISDVAPTATASSIETPTEPATAEPSATPTVEPAPEPTASPTTAPTAAPTSTPESTATPAPSGPPSIDEILALDEPLNIAHAGGDLQSPHSTLFAFSEAVRSGVDILEFDVLTTSDGVVVIQHDLTVDKTTNATGPVNELTLAEFKELDNAYWFSPECWPCQDRPVEEYIYRGVRTGEVTPPVGYTAEDFAVTTLAEIDARFPEMPFDIEIKGEGEQGLQVAAALARELTELGRLDSTIVVSFDDELIDAFHALAPEVEISPGTNRLTSWFLAGTPLDPVFRILQIPPVSSEIEVATAETIARAHAEGLEVWVWPNDASTQENEDFYIELLQRGADGVLAGRPAVMEAALASG